MGSAPISTVFLLITLSAAILLETVMSLAGARLSLSRMETIAVTRVLQMIVLIRLAAIQSDGLQCIGLDQQRLKNGFITGLLWSAGFAAAVVVAAIGLAVAGIDPLALIRAPLPVPYGQRGLFLVVGGVLGPAAEELVFRGIVFGYLRRWGLPAAVVGSTALFAFIHQGPGIPVTQIVGGLVFALAYHKSGSLVAPMMIHTLGNLAIFSLSLV